MEFIRLNAKLSVTANKWEEELKSLLTTKGYMDTGKLYDSIKVTIKYTNDNFEIDIEAKEYIKYLDNGKLFKDWLTKKKNELPQIVQEGIQEDIINNLKL